MQLKAALVVASLSAFAAADFVVITARPTPTNLGDLLNLPSYIASLGAEVTSALASYAADPAARSEASRMNAALRSFASTATYNIPAKVTEVGSLETFTTVPEWYSALPSDVKSYYDKSNKQVESVIMQAAGVSQTTGASASAASGTAGPKATQTGGAARVVAAVGAGVAAAVVGVVAL